LRLGIKQLVPSGLDEYIAEHKEGDVVTGRMMEISGKPCSVELGEGIRADCRLDAVTAAPEKEAHSVSTSTKPDLSSLGSHAASALEGQYTREQP